jgi:hypothetical protein
MVSPATVWTSGLTAKPMKTTVVSDQDHSAGQGGRDDVAEGAQRRRLEVQVGPRLQVAVG